MTKKQKTALTIGGIGLVGYLYLRSRTAPAATPVAPSPPSSSPLDSLIGGIKSASGAAAGALSSVLGKVPQAPFAVRGGVCYDNTGKVVSMGYCSKQEQASTLSNYVFTRGR